MPSNSNSSLASSQVDGHTENQILIASYYLNTLDNPVSFLTNPVYWEIGATSNESLLKIAEGDVEPVGEYVRYWMGFRAVIRPLLAFFNYDEIRHLISICFLLLFAAAAMVIYKHTDAAHALGFALSISLMNPSVIMYSIDHSICYLLAFTFVVAAPRVVRMVSVAYYPLFFITAGMMTQYFDFYTVPIITFAYPYLLFSVLVNGNGSGWRTGKILRHAALFLLFWLAGYAGMWILKLLLTTVFTPVNGLLDGITAFMQRVGIVKVPSLAVYYSPLMAFEGVLRGFLGSASLAYLYSVTAVLFVIPVLALLIRRDMISYWFTRSRMHIVLGLLPLAWFIVTAQPTAIHSYFQYRTISISVFCYAVVFLKAIGMLGAKNRIEGYNQEHAE